MHTLRAGPHLLFTASLSTEARLSTPAHFAYYVVADCQGNCFAKSEDGLCAYVYVCMRAHAHVSRKILLNIVQNK